MSLALSQVESFTIDLAELFTVRPPRISRRRRIRCRWKRQTLHLGRKITRGELAHELAHYIQRELVWPHDPKKAAVNGGSYVNGRHYLSAKGGGHLHGPRFKAWERLIGNYIAQEFGEGEGVVL